LRWSARLRRSSSTPRPSGSSTDPDNGDEGTLADTTELLEVLLCPECDFELGCHDPCGARHVYLADHPLEHRLIRPLVEQYLRTINTNKVCAACSMRINPDDGLLHDVMIARDDCPHVLIREGQVTMARSLYESITGELLRMRDKSGRSML
jgi:hypothetical protein